ncbi:MAG: DUF6653 family protein [Pseudomonadota bacterium]
MDIYRLAERVMAMDDAAWARHANPWSVYTRFSALPLLALAAWSRMWIGSWFWLGLAATLLWIWLNPRLFAEPKSLDSWAARGVMGERLFLDRAERRIDAHHIPIAHGLSVAAGLCGLVALYGVIALDAWATLFGLVVGMGAKAWFCDRMVWIRRDEEARRRAPGRRLALLRRHGAARAAWI